MKLIICLDDDNGMMFNKRRQSRDAAVIEKITTLSQNSTIFIKEYSLKLFDDISNISVFSKEIPKGNFEDFCFIEDEISSLENFNEIYIFRWNRLYPSDLKFNFDLKALGFNLESSEDFVGNSHDKITLNRYVRI